MTPTRISATHTRTLVWVLGTVGSMLAGLAGPQWGRAMDGTDVFVTRSIRGSDVLRVNTTLELAASRTFGVARITVTNTTRKSPRDRNLEIVLFVHSWTGGSGTFAYHLPVVLAEGQSEVTVEIPHTQHAYQSSWDVGIYEDGREIEDKRLVNPNQTTFQWTYHDRDNANWAILRGREESANNLQNEMSRILRLASGATANNTYAGGGTNSTLAPGRIQFHGEATHDWRYFLPYPSWLVSAETLQEINQNNPGLADAVRHYVACGGRLLIYGLAHPMQRIEAAKFFQVEPSWFSGPGWSLESASRVSWWWLNEKDQPRFPQDEAIELLSPRGIAYDAGLALETWLEARIGSHLLSARELTRMFHDGIPRWEEGLRANAISDYVLDEFAAKKVVSKSYLGGTIVVCTQPLGQVPPNVLQKVLNRHSITAVSSQAAANNDGDWLLRNLIEAVGKPPVWIFCGIVGVFGTLLGPGLLYMTGRIGRRSLMILLVPVTSLLATVAIIAYGVLHEGFDTHVRVTSLTRLDADNGSAFSWSRQNYFSGLPPREGIFLNNQTYARPVLDEAHSSHVVADPRQSIECRVWSGERSNWRGWLKARQQQQLLLGHPVRGLKPPVAISGGAKQAIRIHNLSDQDLPFVVARGEGEDYYFLEGLPEGKEEECQPLTKLEAAAVVARATVDFRPEPPPELEDSDSLLAFGTGQSRSRQNRHPGDMLIHAIRSHLSDVLNLDPFTYATILSNNPAVEVPVQGIHSNDLHILIGTQRW